MIAESLAPEINDALGALVLSVGSAIIGIGIDCETVRQVDPKTKRFFMTGAEVNSSDAFSNANLIRIWTVKEALFKATPDNDRIFLTDLLIDEIQATNGGARCTGSDEFTYQYSTIAKADSVVSIALCREIS